MQKSFISRLEKRYKNNRVFFDCLVRLVWCEVAIPFEARRKENRDDWLDIEMPYYCSLSNMQKAAARGEETVRVSAKSGGVYRTARQVLTDKEREHLQAFIDAHYTECVEAFRRDAQLADVFNECMTTALADVRHIPYSRYLPN